MLVNELNVSGKKIQKYLEIQIGIVDPRSMRKIIKYIHNQLIAKI